MLGKRKSSVMEPPKKRHKAVEVIQLPCLTDAQVESCKEQWIAHENDPFPYFRLENVLPDGLIVDKLEAEVDKLEYVEKDNDLYRFEQSKLDIGQTSGLGLPCIASFRSYLFGDEVRTALTKITGITDLLPTCDMSANRYNRGDTLLCHDDRLQGRRLAYVYYLVDSAWKGEVDGGSLDLLEVEGDPAIPKGIYTSLVPVRNSLVVFEVSEKSFHQVSEVMGKLTRKSISGWFHANESPFAIPAPDDGLSAPPYLPLPAKDFSQKDMQTHWKVWVHEMFRSEDSMGQLQEFFQSSSFIRLDGFLERERYESVVSELLTSDHYQLAGPPSQRHYLDLQKAKVGGDLCNLLSLIMSESFHSYMSEVTQLTLLNPRVRIRQFTLGSYTLVQDEGMNENDKVEVILNCATGSFEEDAGGYMVYLDEKEELLTLPAIPNSLCVVYRDPGVMRFVKYVNHTGADVRFDIAIDYDVDDDDDEEEDEEETT